MVDDEVYGSHKLQKTRRITHRNILLAYSDFTHGT